LLQYRGRYGEAEALFRQNAEPRSFGGSNNYRAKSLANLGLLLKQRGELDGARVVYESAKQILMQSKPRPHLKDLARLESNIAALLAQQRNFAEAESVYKSALAKLVRLYGQESQEVGIVCSNYASMLLAAGRAADAESLLTPALISSLESLGSMHPDTANIANNLASARFYMGAFRNAIGPASLALTANRASIGAANPQTMISALNLAAILAKIGQTTRAAAVLAETTVEAERLWASADAAVVPIITLAVNALSKLNLKATAVQILKVFLQAPSGHRHQAVVDLYENFVRGGGITRVKQ
jgi:tetratricopeptide (TPR) repeat protein